MENIIGIEVTVLFEVNIENAEVLQKADYCNDKRKRECIAKAMEDVVTTVLEKHFDNDEQISVSFVAATPMRDD